MNKTIYIIYTIILVLILALSLALNILYKKKVDKLPSNSLLFKNKKIVIFSLLATICISAIGVIYCLTALLFPSNSVTTITRPSLGSDDANLSLITDSELYTGAIDIDVPSKELEFTEALEIFSKYREELNTYVLGDNTSFLEIRSPLFFPASIGEENILISWYIQDSDIIDYTGTPVWENISPDGSKTEIVATLSLGGHKAEVCYTIIVFPSTETDKEKLLSSIDALLTSDDFIYEEEIPLPTEIGGKPVTFYENKSVLPSVDISYLHFVSTFTTSFF